jgi:tetratricopeptide (TPR) repeat protein
MAFLKQVLDKGMRLFIPQKKDAQPADIQASQEYFQQCHAAIELFLKPIAKQAPNELCVCLSGKKFKKCCTGKVSKEALALLEGSFISGDPLRTEGKEKLSDEEQEASGLCASLCEAVIQGKEKDTAEITVTETIKSFPYLPALYNYLYNILLTIGKKEEAQQVLAKMLTLFPTYLFGLQAQAELYFRAGQSEKIPTLFRNCWTLHQLYPDRTLFHVDEMLIFYSTMATYFVLIGDITNAMKYRSVLLYYEPFSTELENINTLIRAALQHFARKAQPAEFAQFMASAGIII